MRHTKIAPLALSLFFLSGLSALIYEMAWVRLLSLSFGVSVYAVSTVLSVFMGGLALGGWMFGRQIKRQRQLSFLQRFALHPGLALYIALQIGIGVYALLTPWLFHGLTNVYVWASRMAGLESGQAAILRIVLAALALLIPTTLMGGTLPALSQFLTAYQRERSQAIGALYTVNTLGAVLGTLLAGLLLIRFFGTTMAIISAAIIDLLIAGLAIWGLSGLIEPVQAETTSYRPIQPEPNRQQRRKAARRSASKAADTPGVIAAPGERQRKIVLISYTISGFTALAYQVVWTRLLAIFSLNAVFSFTIMLATFLTGLALGSALLTRRVEYMRRPMALFGGLQLALGVCAILVLFVFARLPSLIASFALRSSYTSAIWSEFFAAALTLFIPTLLMGALFPVAARIYAVKHEGPAADDPVGQRIGRLYALNTLGAMLGSLIAGFGLIPLLGLQHSVLLLATLNLTLGAVALFNQGSGSQLSRRTVIGLGSALAIATGATLLLPPGFYLGFREGATEQMVFYKEGVDATVSVFEVKNPPLKISFVNGRSEVPTDSQSMRAFYVLGHLPPLLKPDAQNALMISFGNGIATGAMSRHNIPKIQAVELVAEQVQAAQLYTAENRNVLANPRVQIAHEDGRNYLLRSTEHYDIITADATHPINTSSWALFTSEFYQQVRAHLTPGGVFVQWLPFHDLAEEDYRRIVATFASSFPNTTLFYTGGVHTFLVATPEPLTRERLAALEAHIQTAGISDDLGDATRLASDMLMDTQGVAAYTAGAKPVYDDSAFFIPQMNNEQILRSFAPFALR